MTNNRGGRIDRHIFVLYVLWVQGCFTLGSNGPNNVVSIPNFGHKVRGLYRRKKGGTEIVIFGSKVNTMFL